MLLLLLVEPKPWVWPMRRQPGGGALARRGEGTFDSPSQYVDTVYV